MLTASLQCIAELRGKAQYFAKSGLIPTYDGPRNSIVKSDSYIDETLREELARAFVTLQPSRQGALTGIQGATASSKIWFIRPCILSFSVRYD